MCLFEIKIENCWYTTEGGTLVVVHSPLHHLFDELASHVYGMSPTHLAVPHVTVGGEFIALYVTSVYMSIYLFSHGVLEGLCTIS